MNVGSGLINLYIYGVVREDENFSTTDCIT
jgi:hypothetical protein